MRSSDPQQHERQRSRNCLNQNNSRADRVAAIEPGDDDAQQEEYLDLKSGAGDRMS
jgi:hypothetical protein